MFEEDSESDDSDNEGEVTDEVTPPPDFDEEDCQAYLRFKFKHWWLHYRQRLLSDHVRAAYLLSPNPIIQQHCKDNLDPLDRLAMERLMIKIHLSGYVEDDDEWEQKKATMMDKFWREYNDFTSHTGFFKTKSIWISAKNPQCLAHEWHKNYSVPFTEYLGLMGCRICSKVMGIGEAERHWKQLKKVRGGQRARLSANKAKKQATIAANHSMKRAEARHTKANAAGKLWT